MEHSSSYYKEKMGKYSGLISDYNKKIDKYNNFLEKLEELEKVVAFSGQGISDMIIDLSSGGYIMNGEILKENELKFNRNGILNELDMIKDLKRSINEDISSMKVEITKTTNKFASAKNNYHRALREESAR